MVLAEYVLPSTASAQCCGTAHEDDGGTVALQIELPFHDAS
jgi:hypothetical protein